MKQLTNLTTWQANRLAKKFNCDLATARRIKRGEISPDNLDTGPAENKTEESPEHTQGSVNYGK